MKKIYFFDLDGTLVSSVEFAKNMFRTYLVRYQKTLTAELWNIFAPLGYVNVARYMKEHYGDKRCVEEIVQEFYSALIPEYEHNVLFKPHAKEYLHRLRADGHKLYLLSASPKCLIDPCLKNNGVEDLFEKVISTDSYAPYTKNDVELYHQVAKDLGVAIKDIVYFEDNVAPVVTAAKAGITVYGVKDVQPDEDFTAIQKAADKVIYDYAELL